MLSGRFRVLVVVIAIAAIAYGVYENLHRHHHPQQKRNSVSGLTRRV
jgi:uncharacterized membrane protein YebE (DUF533 family)